jgi:transposase-like protein
MAHRCPNPNCISPQLQKNGFYFRSSDSKSIQKWKCLRCKRGFSSATFERAYRHHKRRINSEVGQLLSSGMSLRRIALFLNVHRITVARKLAFLAQEAEERHARRLESMPKVRQVQFDDLITVEHTKCKPLAVSLAVEEGTRLILGFTVSRIPASGLLAAFAKKKYGPRPNQRPKGLRSLLSSLKGVADPSVAFRSDEDPLYPVALKACFPDAIHYRHPGGRGCITGQGELKKLRFDPLFSLNHTCAMLRANINRLFRKTWCTTKKKEGLERHLAVYMDFHNTRLLTV